MRVKIAAFLCVAVLLTGCGGTSDSLSGALLLRNRLLESDGCSFNAAVTADYGKELYRFTMDCKTDKEGNLSFTVNEPKSISGIEGEITDAGGSITFDDRVLAFQVLADGRITPVMAPWLLIKTLRSGYINAGSATGSGYTVTIDDSYDENALRLQISLDPENVPVFAEIFWQGSRILSVTVSDFRIL